MFLRTLWFTARSKIRQALQQPVVLSNDLPIASLNTIKATSGELFRVQWFGRRVRMVSMGRLVIVKVYRGKPYLFEIQDEDYGT